MGVGIWGRIFGGGRRGEAEALYRASVARAREEHWYLAGDVPDTVDGRFDMIAAVLSAVMIRLEGDPAGARPAVYLAEAFVDDMDPQLREIGIGDITVGKHVGKMMAALGGRLGAYRQGFAAGDLRPALVKNLYRGTPPAPAALEHVAGELTVLGRTLADTQLPRLLKGELP